MSYFYRTGLAEVVNASLDYTGRDVTDIKGAQRHFQRQTPNQYILDALEELEEEEQLQRNSITYQAFMKHEVLFIQFKQRQFASFSPRRPSEKQISKLNRKYGIRSDAADFNNNNNNYRYDDDASETTLSRSESTLSSTATGTLSSETSSVTSGVWNERVKEELIEKHGEDYLEQIDEIDIRIAQLQHKRERQGKRRMKYQKENDRSWSSVRKSAPFDNLMNIERESRMDIQEIEEEYLIEIEDAWEKSPVTKFILFHIEETKARSKVCEDEVDDAGDVARRELELDDLLEEEELRRVCAAEERNRQQQLVLRSRCSTTAASASRLNNHSNNDGLTSPEPTAAVVDGDGNEAIMMKQQQHQEDIPTQKQPSTRASASRSPEMDCVIGAVPPLPPSSASPPPPPSSGRESYLKRERLPIPSFQTFKPPKKPPPPPQPKSDEQIEREMKCRKERYARETLMKLEEIDRLGIYAHFMHDALPTVAMKNSDENNQQEQHQPHYEVGSIEERLANMHRMDCRAPTI